MAAEHRRPACHPFPADEADLDRGTVGHQDELGQRPGLREVDGVDVAPRRHEGCLSIEADAIRVRGQAFGICRRETHQEQVAPNGHPARCSRYHVRDLAGVRAAGRATARPTRGRAFRSPVRLSEVPSTRPCSQGSSPLIVPVAMVAGSIMRGVVDRECPQVSAMPGATAVSVISLTSDRNHDSWQSGIGSLLRRSWVSDMTVGRPRT